MSKKSASIDKLLACRSQIFRTVYSELDRKVQKPYLLERFQTILEISGDPSTSEREAICQTLSNFQILTLKSIRKANKRALRICATIFNKTLDKTKLIFESKSDDEVLYFLYSFEKYL